MQNKTYFDTQLDKNFQRMKKSLLRKLNKNMKI